MPTPPTSAAIDDAYADAADEVSLREESGQRVTATRALEAIERFVRPDRLLEIGSWTGVFLDVARERGWTGVGIEPSRWASGVASARGLDVHVSTPTTLRSTLQRSVRLSCDVLEHLLAPGDALDTIAASLCPGGVLYLTVPNAGSRLARMLGRRWWSVLPMHLQYFTINSMRQLLESHGFGVLEVHTHAKVFSALYYAERVESFVPLTGCLPRYLERSRLGKRLVAPNFRDRMYVIARRP